MLVARADQPARWLWPASQGRHHEGRHLFVNERRKKQKARLNFCESQAFTAMVRVWMLLMAAVACSAAQPPVHLGMELNIGASGNYSVVIDGQTWFESGDTAYTTMGKRLTTADGSLKLMSKEQGTGSDASGDYRSVTFTWDDGAFVTTFRKYEHDGHDRRWDGPMLVFEQSFPKGVKGATVNPTDPMAVRDTVSSAFPSFSQRAPTDPKLGMIAFNSDMMGSGVKHGSVTEKFQPPSGVKGFGPVCLFSQDLNNSVVLSSFSQFMAASAGSTSDGIEYGVQGSVTEYPPRLLSLLRPHLEPTRRECRLRRLGGPTPLLVRQGTP
jgi:hypothetical protein